MNGGTSKDVIYGGAGSDYVVFDCHRADYGISRNVVNTNGADGFDRHTDVEYFRFHESNASI